MGEIQHQDSLVTVAYLSSCHHIRMIYLVIQEGETASMCSLLDKSDCSARDFIAIFNGIKHPITASGKLTYWSVNRQSHIVSLPIGVSTDRATL